MPTIRVTQDAHRALVEMATQDNVSLLTMVERAVEWYRRDRFLDQVNQAFAALYAAEAPEPPKEP